MHIRRIGNDDTHSQRQGVKRLPQGIQESMPRHFGKVRLYQIIYALPGARQGKGVDGYHHNEHKEHRNADFAEPLYSGLHPQGYDERRYQQKDQVTG